MRDLNYAFVRAFERSKAPEKQRSTLRLFTLLLLAVFFIALMGGLAAGANIYRSVVEVQTHTGDVQMLSGFLANTAHANDAIDAVEQGEGPEGPALVLVESLPTGTYETRVYKHEGVIMQEYAIAGRPYNPENAIPLFESQLFDFAFDGELITVNTDLGTLDVAVRSDQGGASKGTSAPGETTGQAASSGAAAGQAGQANGGGAS